MSDANPSLNFDFEMETTNPSESMDVTLHENVCTTNHPQENLLQDDHGLVDTHNFNLLQERLTSLEKSQVTLNENVTALMELVKNFMQTMAQNCHTEETVTEVPLPRASTPLVQTFVGSIPIVGGEPSQAGSSKLDPLLTKETTELLKNMKPPIFKGENQE